MNIYDTNSMRQFGLGVKMYNVICEEHNRGDNEFMFEQTFSLSMYIPNPFSVEEGNTREICDALQKTTLIGYSSFVVLIHATCKSRSKTLRKVLKAIKSNPNLRNKFKFIQMAYIYDGYFQKLYKECVYAKHLKNLKMPYAKSVFVHATGSRGSTPPKFIDFNSPPDYNYLPENKKFTANQIKNISYNILADAHCFHQMKVDHAMLRQSLIYSGMIKIILVFDLWYLFFFFHKYPMQRTFTEERSLTSKFHYVLHSSTNADVYAFNVNPALTIIINNYHFTSPHRTREGSEKDVQRFMRTLKIAGISHLVFQDFDRKAVLQLMNCLKHLDCSSLRSLLIVIMSHGGRDDVIHTPNGDVVIKTDIVEALQSNSSLKDVNIAIAVTACRGDIDPQYADRGEIKSIQPTDPSHLAKNTAIIYSTPHNVTSYRCPRHGSLFMQSLCRHIRKDSELRIIVKKINKDLKKETCYDVLEKIPELLICDPQRQYHIHRQPDDASKMIRFNETLVKALKTCDLFTNGRENLALTGQPLFSLAINVRSPHCSEISFEDLYLNPDLEAEHSPLDNDAVLEECRNECVWKKS